MLVYTGAQKYKKYIYFTTFCSFVPPSYPSGQSVNLPAMTDDRHSTLRIDTAN